MRTLNKYINNLKIRAEKLKKENIKVYFEEKAWFKENRIIFHEKERKGQIRWHFEGVLIPTLKQWKSINEMMECYLDMFELMTNSNIENSILPEIEVLKNSFIDIWANDKLYFKQEYLEGKMIDLERKGIKMDLALMQFAEDLANVSHYNNIQNRINELTNHKKEGEIIESEFIPSSEYDNIFTSIQAQQKAFEAMIKLEMINENFVYMLGGNRSMISSFMEVCIEQSIIVSDAGHTGLYAIITNKLGLGELRKTKSTRIEKNKIREILK